MMKSGVPKQAVATPMPSSIPHRKARLRRLAVLAGIVALAVSTAHYAVPAGDQERPSIHSEVRAYLAATADYAIPRPDKVPPAEARLLTAAAKAREDFAPNRRQARRQARLEALNAIRSAYADQLLAEDSIVGVGIGVPSKARRRTGVDWELLVLVAPGSTEQDAAFAVQASGISDLLTDYPLRFEVIGSPQLTDGERPGVTRTWSGTTVGELCPAVGTMGWLVQSRQVDEVYVNGDPTENASIGYLTVLHSTAAGTTHTWEEFQTVPREIEWSAFGNNCAFFNSAGRVIRSGPHDGLGGVGDISQDIDFVALYAERACGQADVGGSSEGIPDCHGFDDATFGYTFLAVPVDTNEINFVSGFDAQICGGVTGEVRTGELDAIHMALEFQVVDWNGNPVVPATTVTLEDTFRIKNDIADPAFSQEGDSGGPVWLLDDSALGGEGAWRPLGVQSAKALNGGGTLVYSFITPLPDNIKDFDVSVISNNPRDPEDEFCTSCNCDCRTATYGVGPREGRLFLDAALATSASGVSRLTSLAIRHEEELVALLQSSDAAVYGQLFEENLAPLLRSAFDPPKSRLKLGAKDVSTALRLLSWIHSSVGSQDLQAEASEWYRFVAAYGNGRDFQELVRLYFLASSGGKTR